MDREILSANVLQKALKERNIESMLEDARNDNKDTDVEHLKRKCGYFRRVTNQETDSLQELFHGFVSCDILTTLLFISRKKMQQMLML